MSTHLFINKTVRLATIVPGIFRKAVREINFKGSRSSASKHFMAFGGGMRFCVRTDFTKVQMVVFLHCLVTKYRWEVIKGGDIVRTPGLKFPNGFYVKRMKKETMFRTGNVDQDVEYQNC